MTERHGQFGQTGSEDGGEDLVNLMAKAKEEDTAWLSSILEELGDSAADIFPESSIAETKGTQPGAEATDSTAEAVDNSTNSAIGADCGVQNVTQEGTMDEPTLRTLYSLGYSPEEAVALKQRVVDLVTLNDVFRPQNGIS